ncbi:F-box/kelch-repeat protein At3g06240-like [Corylus avellana]|uniref:F-box/kelch-repeat protein At3g06240-like n=1 Tax=Corylus avellana TaxID=13451 RepID=UPI00286C8C28|nr:F-box/kelch-repeat protein At3g06240-like [Corylus avellana]
MAKYYFPEEIIREILLRLSHVKSHVRFTCVNKSWRSIIKSPSFVSAHLARTNGSDNDSDRLLLLKHSGTEVNCLHDGSTTAIVTACLGEQVTEEGKHKSKSFVEYAELRFPCKSLSRSFEVVGSCNGLVLLRRYTNTLILWNPSIRKFVSLPKPDNAGYEGCKWASTGWGFGFDSLENDYKVVKIVNHVEIDGDMKVDSHVQVFSLNSGSWKTIGAVGVPGCRFLNDHRGTQAFTNGAIHWLTIARIEKEVFQNIVVSFDVSNEIFREIRLPTEIAYAFPSFLSISVYGKMVAVCVVSASVHYMCCMWVMTECKSWTKLLSFDTINIPKPLGYTKAGELLWERDGGELTSYDPKSQKMVNHNVNGGRWGFCFANSYVETLVLLNEATEQTLQQGRVNKKRKTRNDDTLSFSI